MHSRANSGFASAFSSFTVSLAFLHILNHFLCSFWFFCSFCGFRNLNILFGRPLTLCWGGWWCRQLCFDKLQVVHYPLFCLHKRVPIPFVPWAHHRRDIC